MLPSGDNATILTGQLYGRLPTEARGSSLGLTRTFSYEPQVEEVELRYNNSGSDVLVKTRTTTVGANVNLTLDEVTARNLAIKLMSETAELTQAAATDEVISESDIKAGQITRLSGKNASNVSLQDAATNDLVSGVDYRLYAAAGYILWLKDFESVTGTYDLVEITAASGITTLDLLKRIQGTEIYLTCVPTNDGPQALVEDVLVKLRPAGALEFISQDNDFQTIDLEGVAQYDFSNTDNPFGRVTHMPG